jgi:hypothetical protein
LQRLLMNEEYLKQKSCLKNDVKTFKKWLPQFLAYLSNIVNRQHSVKMKLLLKFHLMTHIAGDMLKWGIPSAYNSSTGEFNHKVLKLISKKTQWQHNLMEERYVATLTISRSLQDLVSAGFVHRSEETRNIEHTDTQTKFSGHSNYLNGQGIYNITTSSIEKLSEWHNMQQYDSIFTFVKEKILPYIDGDWVMISTRFFMKMLYIMGILPSRIVIGKIGHTVTGEGMGFALYKFCCF